MGESKRRKENDPNFGKSKTVPVDLTKPRLWGVISYNDFTKTYLIWCEDGNTRVVSCLHCKTQLQENQAYLGYKDIKNKELILVEPS